MSFTGRVAARRQWIATGPPCDLPGGFLLVTPPAGSIGIRTVTIRSIISFRGSGGSRPDSLIAITTAVADSQSANALNLLTPPVVIYPKEPRERVYRVYDTPMHFPLRDGSEPFGFVFKYSLDEGVTWFSFGDPGCSEITSQIILELEYT